MIMDSLRDVKEKAIILYDDISAFVDMIKNTFYTVDDQELIEKDREILLEAMNELEKVDGIIKKIDELIDKYEDREN